MGEHVRFRATLHATTTGGGGTDVELPDDAVETLDARRRTPALRGG